MRITRENLLQFARDAATARARSGYDLAAIYAVGSLLTDSPLLGVAADIDLIFIHTSEPAAPREIVRLSPELTLDIAHYPQSLFLQPRHLRLDAWVGSSLCQTRLILHDAQHWFEFTQSSVGANFNLPGNVLDRARQQTAAARQVWLDISNQPADPARNLLAYLKALELAANGIAILTGAPLTERRFLLGFPERARAIGKPGLYSGLLGLLGAGTLPGEQVLAWLPSWKETFKAVEGLDNLPARLHPYRLSYYEHACQALASDSPAAALWPLLRTWTLAITCLPPEHAQRRAWQQACADLQLGADPFSEKLAALDIYLDTVDETLDAWGKEKGA